MCSVFWRNKESRSSCQPYFDKIVTRETLKQRRWGLLQLERTRLLMRVSFDLQQHAAMWGFTNPCVRPRTCTPLGPRSINKDKGSRRKNLGAEIWCIFGEFLGGSKSEGCIFKSVPVIHRGSSLSFLGSFLSLGSSSDPDLFYCTFTCATLACLPPHHHQTLVVLRHLKNGPKHLSVFVSMKQTISFKPNGLTSSTLAAPILQSDWSYLYLHSPKMNSKQKISLRRPHLVCLRL